MVEFEMNKTKGAFDSSDPIYTSCLSQSAREHRRD